MNKFFTKYFTYIVEDLEHLSKKIKIIFIFLIYIIIYLLLLLYRYNNQNLSLYNIDIFNLTNLVSLVHFSIIIICLSILYYKHKALSEKEFTKIFFFSLLIIFFVLISKLFPEPISYFLSIIIIIFLIQVPIYVIYISYTNKKNKFIKSIIVALCISFVFILLTSIYVLTYLPDNSIVQNENKTYDNAIIFGAAVWKKNKPSPILRERILKALELYRNQKIKSFTVTGGNASGEISEGEAAKNLLVSKGIPDSLIILENKTSSTLEQIKYIRDSIYQYRGLKNLIVVSDNFHLRRITEMCKFNNINIVGVASDSPLLEENIIFYTVRESVGLILFWYFGL